MSVEIVTKDDLQEFRVQLLNDIKLLLYQQVKNAEKERAVCPPAFETPGLTYKPLYKIAEVCVLFHVSKPTIYDWVKHGKLKPYKIRSRVYFLWQDIQQLLQPKLE